MLKEGVYKQTMECSNQTERNYSGNINGKFWPVQSFDMIEKYGGDCSYMGDESDEEDEDPTEFDSILTREQFESCALPWIQEHEEEASKFIQRFEFQMVQVSLDCIMDDFMGVEADWELAQVPEDKAEMVADYCMLKEIEFFFRETDDDRCFFFENSEDC